MGKVVSYMKALVLAEAKVSEWAKQQWVESSQLNAVRTDEKRRYKVPDQPRYTTKVAEASVKIWHKFLDPNFVSKHDVKAKDIIIKHAQKIGSSYHKWDENLKRAYQTVDGIPAKAFKEKVANSAEYYAQKASLPLRLTGEKARWPGIAVIVPKWLTGDPHFEGLMGSILTSNGPAVNIVAGRLVRVFRSALEQLLVQSGVLILNQECQADIIAEENERINRLVNGFCDSAKFVGFTTGGESRCDFIMDESMGLGIEVQISEK